MGRTNKTPGTIYCTKNKRTGAKLNIHNITTNFGSSQTNKTPGTRRCTKKKTNKTPGTRRCTKKKVN
ncbi:hypothetical protein J6590_042786 [Homalodisca vitripennis]|nr:hypothetical protein J6590_042786 [Homalodisca vitripennis]